MELGWNGKVGSLNREKKGGIVGFYCRSCLRKKVGSLNRTEWKGGIIEKNNKRKVGSLNRTEQKGEIIHWTRKVVPLLGTERWDRGTAPKGGTIEQNGKVGLSELREKVRSFRGEIKR